MTHTRANAADMPHRDTECMSERCSRVCVQWKSVIESNRRGSVLSMATRKIRERSNLWAKPWPWTVISLTAGDNCFHARTFLNTSTQLRRNHFLFLDGHLRPVNISLFFFYLFDGDGHEEKIAQRWAKVLAAHCQFLSLTFPVHYSCVAMRWLGMSGPPRSG